MAKRIVERIEVEMGSGNVFADLGLPDAEKLKIKSGPVIEITRAVRRLGLTQEEAGLRMSIPQPKVSALLRGDFANLSERKLMDCPPRPAPRPARRIPPAFRRPSAPGRPRSTPQPAPPPGGR